MEHMEENEVKKEKTQREIEEERAGEGRLSF